MIVSRLRGEVIRTAPYFIVYDSFAQCEQFSYLQLVRFRFSFVCLFNIFVFCVSLGHVVLVLPAFVMSLK